MLKTNSNYIKNALNYSNPLIINRINEYKRGFEGGRPIIKPTPLCASKKPIESFLSLMKTKI